MAYDVKSGFESQVAETVSRFRWVALAICFLAYMVIYMQRLGLGPLAPFMSDELSLTKAQIGFFTSAAWAGYGIFLIPAGWIADRWGCRWTMCLGQLAGGLCLVTLIFATTYQMVMIAMFITGLGLGFIMPSTTKAVAEWFPLKERAMAMGIKQMGLNFAGVTSAATLPVIAIAFGWRVGFLALGVVAILSGIASGIFYRDRPVDELVIPGAESSAGKGSPASSNKKELMLSLLKSRDIWLIYIAGTVLFVAESGVVAYFVLYLKTYLLVPVVTAGFLLGVINTGGFCGKPVAGLISDRIFGGKRKTAWILLAGLSTVIAAVFAFMPVGTSQWLILLLGFLYGFSALGWGGLYMTMLAECAGRQVAATAFGIGSVFVTLGNVFGVPLFGYISDVTGVWMWSWIYLIAMGAVGTVAVSFVREERRRLST